MPIPLVRCLRGIIDHATDAIVLARLGFADWRYGPLPETATDRLRAARLRGLVEEGRAIGLLDDGEDEATLAWHEARHRSRGR